MKVKKSLESRIHGWLPKEAKVSKAPAKMDFQIKLQPKPPNQLGQGTVRATIPLGVYSLFFIILNLSIVLVFHDEIVDIIAGFISGLLFGLAHSAWATRRILKKLEKFNRYSLDWKEYFLITVPVLIFCFSFLLVGTAFDGFPSIQPLTGFLSSVFTFITISYLVRLVLFFSYEKTKKVWVMQGSWSESKNFSSVPQAAIVKSGILPEKSSQFGENNEGLTI